MSSRVWPTTAKSPTWVRTIFCQSVPWPAWWRASARLATIPSRPICFTASRKASPSVSTGTTQRMRGLSPVRRARRVAAGAEGEAAEIASLAGQEVEGPEGGRWSARARGWLRWARAWRRAKEGRPSASSTTASPSRMKWPGGERAEGVDQLRELGRGVAAAPVAEANLVAVPFGEDAVAVVLQLEPPSGAGEGALGAGGELEVDVGQTDRAEGERRRRPGPSPAQGAGGSLQPCCVDVVGWRPWSGGVYLTRPWRHVRSARGPSPSAW